MVRYLGYSAVGQVAVRPEERLEVAGPRCDAAAAELPLRYQLLAQLRVVVELLGHLFGRQPDALLVVLALHEDVEGLVRARDDALAVLEVVLRVSEAPPLLLGVDRVRVWVVAAEVL
jgi:hypothetical protein